MERTPNSGAITEIKGIDPRAAKKFGAITLTGAVLIGLSGCSDPSPESVRKAEIARVTEETMPSGFKRTVEALSGLGLETVTITNNHEFVKDRADEGYLEDLVEGQLMRLGVTMYDACALAALNAGEAGTTMDYTEIDEYFAESQELAGQGWSSDSTEEERVGRVCLELLQVIVDETGEVTFMSRTPLTDGERAIFGETDK